MTLLVQDPLSLDLLSVSGLSVQPASLQQWLSQLGPIIMEIVALFSMMIQYKLETGVKGEIPNLEKIAGHDLSLLF